MAAVFIASTRLISAISVCVTVRHRSASVHSSRTAVSPARTSPKRTGNKSVPAISCASMTAFSPVPTFLKIVVPAKVIMISLSSLTFAVSPANFPLLRSAHVRLISGASMTFPALSLRVGADVIAASPLSLTFLSASDWSDAVPSLLKAFLAPSTIRVMCSAAPVDSRSACAAVQLSE